MFGLIIKPIQLFIRGAIGSVPPPPPPYVHLKWNEATTNWNLTQLTYNNI